MNSMKYMMILLSGLVLSACSADTYCATDGVLRFSPRDSLTSESKEMVVKHNCTYLSKCDSVNYKKMCDVQGY